MPVRNRQKAVLILLLLLLLYSLEPRLFRRKFKQRKPLINAITIGLNDSAQFIAMSGFHLDVFKVHVIEVVKPILLFPVHSNSWMVKW